MRAAGGPDRSHSRIRQARHLGSGAAGGKRIDVWPRRTCPVHAAEELER